MRTTWTFNSAGQIVFGQYAVEKVGEIAAKLTPQKRVMLVTDKILVDVGLAAKVIEPLRKVGIDVILFDGGEPEPSVAAANRCIEAAREVRPEVMIGLGGGSNMDLAKTSATVFQHGGEVLDYAGDEKIPGPIMPLICIPTTAGTGSEVSGSSVITDTENEIKVGILSNYLRPTYSIVDPLMTVSCPKKVTADSGIDALTHAIEAFTAVDNAVFPLPEGEKTIYQGKNFMADTMALKSIELCSKFLIRAVDDGSDLEAREGMSLAAMLGGLAFSNAGVASVHAIEYPVGGAVHCSHGEGNGLLLPYVMEFNLPERMPEFVQIAEIFGYDVSNRSPQDAAYLAVEAMQKLKQRIGIPEKLNELGVKEEMLDSLAEKAFAVKRILRVNPRTMSQADIRQIYANAL